MTEMIECACGCGEMRPKYDNRGRQVFYLKGHQNRMRTEAQREAWTKNMGKRPLQPWNKGKTYVHDSKDVYANKGSWNKAMRRIYPNQCMRCGWSEGGCDTHHIIPKSQGDKFTLENGIILCPNCHRLVHDGKLTNADLSDIKTHNR